MRYGRHFNTRKTPQTQAIPGREHQMVENSAGGYSFKVDDWTCLRRFLILGTEGGSYYASEQKLTVENAKAAKRCIDADGVRAVREVVEISDAGRAPKNDPAIFVLAMCLKLGDLDTRRAAVEAVPKVCRIGTHLFQLAEAVKAFGGWGQMTMRAFRGWYESKSADQLALQVCKYQSRAGWSHADVLRKCHLRDNSSTLRWAARRLAKDLAEDGAALGMRTVARRDQKQDSFYDRAGDLHPMLVAVDALNGVDDRAEVCRLIRDHRLPREVVPTRWLNDADVWETLLFEGGKYGMPITALIRNLAKMTSVGLLKPLSPAVDKVCETLRAEKLIQHARVHPIKVLTALKTYAYGRGIKGSLTWNPVQQIVDALDDAFYLAFGNVEPTGKRYLLGIDVSSSMAGGNVAGVPGLTPRIGAAAMALVTAKTESKYHFMGFSHHFVPLNISPRQRLDAVVRAIGGIPFGRTDCALPMTYALDHQLEVDVFVIYTDNETYVGNIHPLQALQRYRERVNPDARMATVSMVPNSYTIALADGSDSGQVDFIGFDTATPELLAGFARGEF
jgi:60 kDa SS-A/Ro ribonucleoprotein